MISQLPTHGIGGRHSDTTRAEFDELFWNEKQSMEVEAPVVQQTIRGSLSQSLYLPAAPPSQGLSSMHGGRQNPRRQAR